MKQQDIIWQRLHNQRLVGSDFETPTQAVQWLGAVQAQVIDGGMWTIGMRMAHGTESEIEQAITDGRILRTHLLRPTWHFVAAQDIRWLLDLTGPRINARDRTRQRQLELDEDVFQKTNAIIRKALAGGVQLTRQQIKMALEAAGIIAAAGRLAHIMMRAEIDGVVCSGARDNKQSTTYALLDERVPDTATLDRDAGLAELVKRYFQSHGPATAHDFARWSGLTVGDANQGIEIVGALLDSETVDGTTYYFVPMDSELEMKSPIANLLSPYDDFTLGYKDHPMGVDPVTGTPIKNAVYPCVITIDGGIVGTWTWETKGNGVMMSITPVNAFSSDDRDAIEIAAAKFGDYLARDVVVQAVNRED